MARRVWVVLPDLLSIRIFFDTAIMSGLRERLPGELATVFLVPRDDAAAWAGRFDDVPALHGEELTATEGGVGERGAQRLDSWLDGQIGYYPLAIRLNYRHGFHLDRMHAGHPNWMLDSDREGLAATLEARRGRDAALALQPAAARPEAPARAHARGVLRARPLERPAAKCDAVSRGRAAPRAARGRATSRAGITPSARGRSRRTAAGISSRTG